MDNKLSELSKPVDICNWKMDSWRAAPCNGTEWAKGYFEGWNKYHQKVEGLAPLYSQEYVSALLAELEAKDKRIAEVEVSHKKLRETLAAVHNTITGGGAYTSLAGILTAVKRAYLESSDASARTVTVEGDA